MSDFNTTSSSCVNLSDGAGAASLPFPSVLYSIRVTFDTRPGGSLCLNLALHIGPENEFP